MLGGTVVAQVATSANDYLELIMERYEDDSPRAADEMLEMLQHYAENPLNLNDTVALMRQDMPLLSEFHKLNLLAYIRQNGPMLSLNELRLVYGFDSAYVALLIPFVEVSPVSGAESVGLRAMLRHGRHGLRIGGGRTVEPAAGYLDSTYFGSPWRFYYRYQFHYRDRINFSFAGEKDAGEEFFRGTQRQGFDHYGLNLTLKDFGRLRQLSVGRYQLQFGQGLTLWTGFAPYSATPSTVCRRGYGIRSASAFGESDYLRGAAATVSLTRHLDLTLFYSDAMRDATVTAGTLSLYTSGYHRSMTELAKRDTLRERLYGGHIGFAHGAFSAGFTAYRVDYSMPLMPAARRYNTYAFRGNAGGGIGIDARYLMRNFCLFGEAAASPDTALAALAGARWMPAGNHQFSLTARDYSMRYQNLYASATGQNSSPQNERGIEFMYEGRLPHDINLQAAVDVFAFPWLKYRVYQPSDGVECRLRCMHNFSPRVQLVADYRLKNADRNAVSDGSVLEDINRHQLWLGLKATPSPALRLTSRVQGVYVQRTVSGACRGVMACQEAAWMPSGMPFTLIMRGYWFNAQVYDARIYCYESAPLYESGSAMLYGKGFRAFAMLRCDISTQLSLAVRYAVTAYLDRDAISSGHDRIDAPHKQTVHLQLYWNI